MDAPNILGHFLLSGEQHWLGENYLTCSEIWVSQQNMHYIFGIFIGDKFGESLGGSQAPPSFWEVPGLPRKFPELPRKFFGDFPGSSFTVELNSNPEVPRKFPKLPRKFPKLPQKFPDFPGGRPLSLGSLTPSPDSQNLCLNSGPSV